MVTQIIGTSAFEQTGFPKKNTSTAASLGPNQRKQLALDVIQRTQPVSHLAQDNDVSRKFLYQQAAKASEGLDQTFAPSSKDNDVLFYLPITKKWIHALVLALILNCHSSFRGVIEILRAMFDYHDMSPGTIHNIVQRAIVSARNVNDSQDLSTIRIGDHDEIYQANRPVLAGIDHQSTYCYLLSVEDSCNETSWGVHLLDLTEQGLNLERTIADGGKALRAGQKAAWGDTVPCDGDVFHAQMTLSKLAAFLERRAYKCMNASNDLQDKMERAKKKTNGQKLSKKLALARQAEAGTIDLADLIIILVGWMSDDILSVAGPNLQERRKLYDFVVEQLRRLEPQCSYRIRPVRIMLENHCDHLLGFVGVLDDRLLDIAYQFNVEPYLVHEICELQSLDKRRSAYWQRRGELQAKHGAAYHGLECAVLEAMTDVPRASSLVENLNSRLRNYFFLRHHIGNGYLDLLRFYLNHHRFDRSDRAERVGKSPVELLTGQYHSHWLELLGFQRFQRN
jgi:hypothetical protein